MPDSTARCELAVRAEAERVAFEELAVDLAEAGRERLAVERVERRLGVEHVDVARTAPTMNRKMQRFAFPGKCPTFAARGLPTSAAWASRSSSPARPRSPNPPPTAQELTAIAGQERLRTGTARFTFIVGHRMGSGKSYAMAPEREEAERKRQSSRFNRAKSWVRRICKPGKTFPPSRISCSAKTVTESGESYTRTVRLPASKYHTSRVPALK